MDQIRKFFDRDKLAKALGIECVELSPGRAKTRMTIREDHYNSVRIVHGAATFALADFAFALACNSYGTAAVGISASMSWLKAVDKGVLTAEAEEVSKSPKLGTYLIRIRDEAGDVVAVFQGTAYRKKEPLIGPQS